MHSCGFDSIPSDLTVYALYRRAREDRVGDLGDTTCVVRLGLAGGVSGVRKYAAFSMIRTSWPPTAPPSPSWAHNRTFHGAAAARSRRARRAVDSGVFLAPYNTRVVRRSNALQGWAYGRRFRYAETMSVGSHGLPRFPRRRRSPPASSVWEQVSATIAGADGGTPRPQTGHRSERGDARARPLFGRDLHHHDDRGALRRRYCSTGRWLLGHLRAAGRECVGAGTRPRSAL